MMCAATGRSRQQALLLFGTRPSTIRIMCDQLTSVDNGGAATSFEYEPQGSRIKKSSPTETVRYTYIYGCTEVDATFSAAIRLVDQLIRSGYDGDLLNMYLDKINPGPADTLNWLQKLLRITCPVKPWRRGYWAFLNARLPVPWQL